MPLGSQRVMDSVLRTVDEYDLYGQVWKAWEVWGVWGVMCGKTSWHYGLRQLLSGPIQ